MVALLYSELCTLYFVLCTLNSELYTLNYYFPAKSTAAACWISFIRS